MLLERRTAAVRREAEVAIWIDAGAGLALLLLGMLLYAISRDIARRDELETALRESARFQEQFVAILGHDLRNPLSAISAGASLLRRIEAPQLRASTVARIAASAARMHRMVDQLLDLTRARLAGGIPVQPRRGTNLAEVARSAVDELRVAHPDAQLTLHTATHIRGEWDADRMAQVISNLVANAISYGDGAPVEVEVNCANGAAVLAVHNGGLPIPADVLPRIFDPFRRATEGPAAPDGLGLGLFITREIVLAHGGTIAVTSARQEGTTFTVTLPAATAQNSYAEARNT
jgi:signal transduction histidine kinase